MKRLMLALLLVTAIGAGCAPGFTRPATDITATTATLNGDVGSSIGGTVNYTFHWGETPATLEFAGGTVETEKDVKEPISVAISNLEPQTLYTSRSAATTTDVTSAARGTPSPRSKNTYALGRTRYLVAFQHHQ